MNRLFPWTQIVLRRRSSSPAQIAIPVVMTALYVLCPGAVMAQLPATQLDGIFPLGTAASSTLPFMFFEDLPFREVLRCRRYRPFRPRQPHRGAH